ncbi:unnamed protein product [Toxocara canis]|uniref:COesterase domain-containing protein n=1 Tax=Toxocara canis TaxID=6265 RepID=A0A183UUX0_TOXCA|nr:unnamed protein product [Toxocara canis]
MMPAPVITNMATTAAPDMTKRHRYELPMVNGDFCRNPVVANPRSAINGESCHADCLVCREQRLHPLEVPALSVHMGQNVDDALVLAVGVGNCVAVPSKIAAGISEFDSTVEQRLGEKSEELRTWFPIVPEVFSNVEVVASRFFFPEYFRPTASVVRCKICMPDWALWLPHDEVLDDEYFLYAVDYAWLDLIRERLVNEAGDFEQCRGA